MNKLLDEIDWDEFDLLDDAQAERAYPDEKEQKPADLFDSRCA